MKKILPIFLLSIVFMLPGCSSGNFSSCRFGGPPNGHYIAFYPDGVALSGTIDALGVFRVPTRGYSCAQIRPRIGLNFGFALAASPSSVYLPGPPATGTITGQGFDATYGMPVVEYFDNNGYLVGSAYADSVSGDGTSLQANLPNLSYAYSGTYQIKVTNKSYDGYYLDIVGSATVTGWGRDRPDSDGDGWYDDEDCDPYDPYRNFNCNQTCGGGPREPITICQEY